MSTLMRRRLPALLSIAAGVTLNGCAYAPAPAGATGAPHASPQSAETGQGGQFLMRIADKAAASGDFDIALAFYGRAAQLHPHAAAAQIGLGEAHAARGDYEAAHAAFAAALDAAPKDPRARIGLATALLSLQRPQEAAAALSGGVVDGPHAAVADNVLGVALDVSGRHDEAQAAYRRGLEHQPDGIELRNNLALSLAFTGAYDEADKLMSDAAAQSSRPETQQNRALVSLLRNQFAAQGKAPDSSYTGLATYALIYELGGGTARTTRFKAFKIAAAASPSQMQTASAPQDAADTTAKDEAMDGPATESPEMTTPAPMMPDQEIAAEIDPNTALDSAPPADASTQNASTEEASSTNLARDGSPADTSSPAETSAKTSAETPAETPAEIAMASETPDPPMPPDAAAPMQDAPAAMTQDTAAAPPPSAPPAAPPAPPASAVAAGAETAFQVQLGSYRSPDRARRSWSLFEGKAPTLLGPLTASIEKADLGGDRGVFFRLRTPSFPDRPSAQALCDSLKASALDCIVVTVAPPAPTPAPAIAATPRQSGDREF